MAEKIHTSISALLNYAEEHNLIEKSDRRFCANSLMDILALDDFCDDTTAQTAELCVILGELCDFAFEKGLIESNSVVYRDLFDTKIMGVLTPRPSEFINKFNTLYNDSKEAATDYFYNLSIDSNYIRSDRIKKDVKWVVGSEYGDIDITINLSKPEKDPKAIAAAKLIKSTDYPKCALCPENEGFAGNTAKAPRQNIRLLPIKIAGEDWFMQYSPYVYYNEHCIALSGRHVPMSVNRSTFVKLLDFVELFPHYFLGSNADLPIVGGSILSHDHMQGGRYTFAMERAEIEKSLVFKEYEEVEAGIVKWPMSVIRLRSTNKDELIELADKILKAWRGYTDETLCIFAETDGEPHNTITPIARMKDGKFELDLVLRNNLTSEERPLGVYHPRPEYHNIKKENIGLIEVMGLAVLPARLKDELDTLASIVVSAEDIRANEKTQKHAEWFEKFKDNYVITRDNVKDVLYKEVGKTFVGVLTDAGVYKRNDEGMSGFMAFINHVNTL